MKSGKFEGGAEAHFVAPARDAERSEYHINDFCKDDPRSRFHDRGQPSRDERQFAPIGVFDSGAGGLTILSALREELPHENYIYLGDTRNCPYGAKSETELRKIAVRAGGFLVEQGVKLIVVACNTASQAALHALREAYPQLSFVGVVPAVKPAARATRHGRIGIAATNRAVQDAYLHRLIEEFAADIQVHAIGCPALVTLVERGELDGPEVEATLREALNPLLANKVDVIVLGCTHFPAMRPAIERIVGSQVLVIDSGAAIARRTHSILNTEELLRPARPDGGQLTVWSSGAADSFSQVASKILGSPVIVNQCNSL